MKLHPISSYAAKQTKLRLKRFSKSLRHAAKHAEDPEAIHDLRVSIRRAAQTFKTFSELFDPAPVKKLRRRLRRVMDLCAAVRNCDVALTLLDEGGVATDARVARLQKMRDKAAKKLHRGLRAERRKRHATPKLRSHPKEHDWELGQSLEGNLSRILPGLAEEFFAAASAAFTAPENYPKLHQFRLQAKRFRYTLELFECFYGSKMPEGAEILKELQGRLGAINDCAATIPILGRDRRAVAAIGKLLGQRTSVLQTYAQSEFMPQKLGWWKCWLAQPLKAPSKHSQAS